MVQAFVVFLRRFPPWPMAAVLLVGFLVCNMGFDWRQDQLGCETRLLDVRGWYSPDEARHLLAGLGSEGRRLYGISEITLDLAFPLIYGSLFGLLILQLFKESVARRLLVVPLVSVIADVLENALVAYLALFFDGHASALTWAAAVFTATKMVAFLGAIALILIGAAKGLVGGAKVG